MNDSVKGSEIMQKLKECQKEFLFNSRYLLDLRVAQQPSDREEFPKMTKRLCKYTGRVITTHLPDEIYAEDYIDMSKENLDYMLNEICKNCEYCDFF